MLNDTTMQDTISAAAAALTTVRDDWSGTPTRERLRAYMAAQHIVRAMGLDVSAAVESPSAILSAQPVPQAPSRPALAGGAVETPPTGMAQQQTASGCRTCGKVYSDAERAAQKARAIAAMQEQPGENTPA